MLSKDQIKQILVSQRETILKKDFGLPRTMLSYIGDKKNLPHVIVLTGLRRSGKSTLLKQIIETYYDNKDFYYITFEDERLFNFQASDFNDIYECLIDLYGPCKTFFIDEIQNIQNFETFVRRFYEQGFKFYITGSSAHLLSRELGTKLTGRHVDIMLKPFSFFEFLSLKGLQLDKESLYKTENRVHIKQLFEEYVLKGGMPEYLIHDDLELLMNIYDDIIIKDIAVRYHIDNVATLREVYLYLISNFSKPFSYNEIKKTLGIGSVNTVINHISYLEETNFIQTITKFDNSIKKQLINNKKIYLVDTGFLQILSTRLTTDKGWMLENIVFNQLKNQHTDVFYHTNKHDCDFIVIEKKAVISVVQVTWELHENNRDREIKGVYEAMDVFNQDEGMILTFDQEDIRHRDNKTIYIKPVWKWLLEQHIN
ncbi:MAG: ATP-binding protein [Candidatus Thermoplasmatota archaeon]|nr:ATP-binding protein [Candidatus Thermoplasmatota archaeon]